MSALTEIATARDQDRWVTTSRVIAGLVVLFVIWSFFAKIDEVAIAPGEVVPQGRLKTIQHFEGGLIEDIFVREGDTVRLDTPLIQLDLAASVSSRAELQARMDTLSLRRTRLEAEATGQTPVFDDVEAARQPAVRDAEKAAFDARARELESSLAVLNDQLVQRQQDVREVEVMLSAAEQSLALSEQRLAMSADLLTDKLQSPMEHLELEGAVTALRGEAQSLTETLPRAEAALREAQARVTELELKFRREARELLGETEATLASLTQRMIEADEQETRTTIRSPTNGVVKNLRYNTLGGVVRPGEPIMDIVPTEDALVVEARLNPIDRGFVSVGQPAVVKVDTYDFARYGGLNGTVVSVAPDSTVPDGQPPYFLVVVETERIYLGQEDEGRLIAPGMGTTVDIQTGTRTVVDYLIRPVLKLRSEAFRER